MLRCARTDASAIPILWWRDFPYVARDASPGHPFAARMAALPSLEIPLGPAAADAKRAACLAYASQLGFQFGGAAGLDARLAATGGTESFRLSATLPAGLSKTLAVP